MGRRKKNAGRISIGGNLRRPGQTGTQTIVLTQPKRFGIDIADMVTAIHAFENVDYSRRYKLYDLYSDILMDTHLSSVIDKRVQAVLSLDIEFQRGGKPDDRINEQLQSPWFRRCIEDILAARWWGFSLMQFYREGEWRGAVAVGIVDHQLRNLRNVELHTLLACQGKEFFLVGFLDMIEQVGELLA
jgi:hypothetical protein